MMAHAEAISIWAISLAGIFCMLLRPRRISEAYWVCGAALVLVASRLLPLRQAAHAVREGFDVYLFLTGMMLLAELAREEGVFEWLADTAAQHSGRSPSRLFMLVYAVGIAVTALLSNDATAVVLTPAVLAVVRRAKVSPKPYLLACALIANAASFVFPISNPANLVIFDQHMPPLYEWLKVFAVPSVVAIAVTFACLRWLSRRELRGSISSSSDPAALSREGKLAFAGLLAAAAALLVFSTFGLPLGAPTCIAAVFAVAIVTFRDRTIPARIVKGVSWSVLPLVAGLFVIVEALQNAGLRAGGLTGLQFLAQMPTWAAKTSAAFSVAFLSNLMNNLPVALMGGAAIRQAHESGIVAHAILIGIDLGPNLSVTGSLATILWLIALRREKIEISAWEFLKVGALAMPLALLSALLFLRS